MGFIGRVLSLPLTDKTTLLHFERNGGKNGLPGRLKRVMYSQVTGVFGPVGGGHWGSGAGWPQSAERGGQGVGWRAGKQRYSARAARTSGFPARLPTPQRGPPKSARPAQRSGAGWALYAAKRSDGAQRSAARGPVVVAGTTGEKRESAERSVRTQRSGVRHAFRPRSPPQPRAGWAAQRSGAAHPAGTGPATPAPHRAEMP
ncbi:hypothetical protein GCM10010336_75080 [Streptomyces goshikiensis]|nr:hypothetical protein GCM10010336_75080 [Streptomyces goshikiensis]